MSTPQRASSAPSPGHSAPGAPSPPSPQPPTIPDHQLLRSIGGGSYGEVWLARSVMGTYRAVKIVHRHTFDHDRPFEREFAGIQKFEPISRSHEGLVDLLQVGRNDAEGYFYYVMELADDANAERGTRSAESAEGTPALTPQSALGTPQSYEPRTLRSLLRPNSQPSPINSQPNERLPLDECIQLGLSLTDALAYLHGHGLVHRDIKPSNIIFVGGAPKLADVGLVTGMDEARSYVGTEGFIPPEGPGTPQADLYSLGILLYQMSTGKSHQDFPEPLPDLAAQPDHARWLEFNAVIHKACAANPCERYQSAKEMCAELGLLQSGHSVRHLRAVERRLAIANRIGLVTAALLVVAAVAYFFAATQARRAERAREVTEQFLYDADTRLAQQALEEGNLGQARNLLAAHAPQPGRKDLRGFEWRYLWNQCQGDQFHAWRDHQGIVTCLAFSPDGRTLATGSRDRTVILWDMATLSKVATLNGHSNDVVTLAFSPDGKLLATGSDDGFVRLWSLNSREVVRAFKGDPARLAFAPTGTRLAVGTGHATYPGFGGQVTLWDYTTGQSVKILTNSGGRVAFSRDGKLLATGSWKQTVSLWDMATGESRGAFTNAGDVCALSFSPDGKNLATCNWDGGVHLWEISTGRLRTLLANLHAEVWSVAFSPDGELLAVGSTDQTIHLWDVASGDEMAHLRGHGSEVWSLAFSPDGNTLASGGKDEAIMLWHRERKPAVTMPTVVIRNFWLGKPVFSPDGRCFAALSASNQVTLWDTATCQPRTVFHDASLPLGFSRDGKTMIALGTNFSVQHRDVATGKLGSSVTLLEQEPKEISAIALAPNHQQLTVGTSAGSMRMWNITTSAPLAPLDGHAGEIKGLAFSPDGRILASASDDKTAALWDTATGRRIATLNGHKITVFGVAFSPNGQTLATSSWDDTVKIWDVATKREVATLTGYKGGAYGIGISADGRVLASGCWDGIIRLTNLATHREVATLKHGKQIDFLVFSPDGETLISVNTEGALRLWRAPTQ